MSYCAELALLKVMMTSEMPGGKKLSCKKRGRESLNLIDTGENLLR